MFRSRAPHGSPSRSDLRHRETLAQVFDETAPALLRLAIHLVGDAAVAEDLVQETFLAALESAERYDPERPVLPWLQGILAMRVRRHGRERGRKPEVVRLLERAEASGEQDPVDPERSAALADAIDTLPSPYREVLLLRARHGLSPADIAHVLNRTPGAVRVQLHRGIKQLKRIVPTSLALLALTPLAPTRGLAAVKQAVLDGASARLALGAGAGIGGSLVMGKVFMAAGAALLICALLIWRPWETDMESGSADGPPPIAGEETRAPRRQPRLEGTAAESTADRDGPSVRPTASTTFEFTGRVVDASAEDAGIEGATLSFYPSQLGTLSDVLRTHRRFVKRLPEGRLQFLGPTPIVLPPYTAGQQLGTEPVDVYMSPPDSAAPLATATTDAEGAFRLHAPGRPGLLVVKRAGYASRQIATRGGATNTSIAMQPLRHVLVQLVHPDGSPFTEHLTLVLSGDSTGLPLGVTQEVPWNEKTWAPNEAQVVETDTSGRCAARLGAEMVTLHCRTPGYWLRGEGKTGRGNSTAAAVMSTREVPTEARRIVVEAVATLHVTDAATGAPLPEVCFHGRGGAHGLLSFAGRAWTLDGSCTLVRSDVTWQRAAGAAITLKVWADGYAPESVHIPDLGKARHIEVALTRGEAPALTVRVRSDARPVADATLSLATYRTIGWTGTEFSYVAAVRTNSDGVATLRSPDGSYLLTVCDGIRTLRRTVTIPQDADITIDFEHEPGIDVRVLDARGDPREGHSVGINGYDGRSTRDYTDVDGWAHFEGLTAGLYKVFIPRTSTHGSFSGDMLKEVQVGGTGRKSIEFRLVERTPFVLYVQYDGTGNDLTTWRARVSQPATDGRWQKLHADGRAPLETGDARRIEIETAEGRRYDVLVPQDGGERRIHIPSAGPRYMGRLTYAGGQPCSGWRVIALPNSNDEDIRSTWPSTVTDAEGRFEIVCRAEVVHRFVFNRDPRRASMAGTLNHNYLPKAAPSGDPKPLDIRLPGEEAPGAAVTIRGTVIDDVTGEPMPKALTAWAIVVEDEGGTLEFGPRKPFVYADDHGRFEVVLPRCETLRVSVSDRATGRTHREVFEIAASATELTRNIRVPAKQ